MLIRGRWAAPLVCAAMVAGCGTEAKPVGQRQSAITPNITGDINGDSVVNSIDLQMVVNRILAMTANYDADVNRDGQINSQDLQLMVNDTLADHSVPSFTFAGGYWSPTATSGSCKTVGAWRSSISLADIKALGKKAIILFGSCA